MSNDRTVLVTGASGQLGRLVLDALMDQPSLRVIAATRTTEKLASYASAGVEIRAADFNDPASLTTAFQGVDRLLLISTDAIGSRIQQHTHAIDAAKTAGVQHLVYTSWPNPDRSEALVAREHLATETLIQQSGLGYTILRNYPYAESLLRSLPAAIKAGTLYGSAGQGKIAYVTRADCARAAAGALKATGLSNSIDNITGPKAVSYEELMAIVSEQIETTIPYVDIPPDQLKAVLMKSGLPEIWAQLLVSFDLSIKNGELAETSDAVRTLSGTAAEDLQTFLRKYQDLLLGAKSGT